MRIAIAILALLAFAVVSPAHAAPDKTSPGPSAAQSPPGAGSSGAPPRPDASPKPNKPEKADKPDKSDKPEKPEKPDKAAPPGLGPAGPGGASNGPGGVTPFDPVDQDEALRAVERREALPLAHIVAIAERRPAGGSVVNARLVRIRDFLLYQLTMLDDTGRSWRDYYYARSGNPAEIN